MLEIKDFLLKSSQPLRNICHAISDLQYRLLENEEKMEEMRRLRDDILCYSYLYHSTINIYCISNMWSRFLSITFFHICFTLDANSNSFIYY